MSKVTDQIMSDAGVTDLPQRFRPQAAEVPPPLPTVGRMVHFYCANWSRVGPWPAVVTVVDIHSEIGSPEIVATVCLTVAGMGHSGIFHDSKIANMPWFNVIDVPGIIPGVEHSHQYWWQWPERG